MEHVNRPVRVFWENEGEWFRGVITDFSPELGHFIQYEDGDEEWAMTLEGVEFEDEAVGGEDLGMERFESKEWKGDQENELVNRSPARTLTPSPVLSPQRSSRKEPQREYSQDDEKLEASRGWENEEEDNEQNNNKSDGDQLDEELGFQSSLHSTNELNSNSVLLKGEILGANNLPQAEGDESSGVFYRVLYAEGGDESAVFRCKTPIYKSSVAHDLEFPRWDCEKKFRFEMVMPGDAAVAASNFTDHGEIIIAVYKSRVNGGSDFVGQVSIQLQDFVRVGTVGRARPNSHCRLLRGCFPLISRHGDIVGGGLADVDIDISLEWRLLDKPKPSSAERNAVEAITARNKKQGLKTTDDPSKKPNKSKKQPNVKQKGNSASAMSSLRSSRRNREQAWIDKQNEKLRNRLVKAGPKQASKSKPGSKSSDNSTVGDVYRPQAAEKKKPARRDIGAKGSEAKAKEARSTSRGLPSTHEELLREYESLRKKISEAKGEVKALKTTQSKLSAQVARSEGVVARLKKTELSSRKRLPVGTEEGAKEAHSDSSERYSVESILLRAGIETGEESITDELLREQLAEHSTLQQTRASCVERIEKAKAATARDEAAIERTRKQVQERRKELQERAARADKPKEDWNLHVLNKESRLTALRAEISDLSLRVKLQLGPQLGAMLDEIANSTARCSYLEGALQRKKNELDGVRLDVDKWKERLSELRHVEGLDMNLPSHLRQAVAVVRNSLKRMKRHETLMDLKRQSDAVELEVLRHNLNSKQSM